MSREFIYLEEMQMETHQGVISLYSQKKPWAGEKGGWGFINEVWFFHISHCVPSFVPVPGALVEFELGPPYKLGRREQAINVRPAKVEATVQGGIKGLANLLSESAR